MSATGIDQAANPTTRPGWTLTAFKSSRVVVSQGSSDASYREKETHLLQQIVGSQKKLAKCKGPINFCD